MTLNNVVEGHRQGNHPLGASRQVTAHSRRVAGPESPVPIPGLCSLGSRPTDWRSDIPNVGTVRESTD